MEPLSRILKLEFYLICISTRLWSLVSVYKKVHSTMDEREQAGNLTGEEGERRDRQENTDGQVKGKLKKEKHLRCVGVRVLIPAPHWGPV